MKQERKGSYFDQDQNEEKILAKIKRECGQGDWDIKYNISGSMINCVATRETKEGLSKHP